jgi:hypothetical protein
VSPADHEAFVDRRGFLKRAATGAVTAAVPISKHAQDHDHDQQVVSSDPALRKRLRIHGIHEGNSAFSRTEQG